MYNIFCTFPSEFGRFVVRRTPPGNDDGVRSDEGQRVRNTEVENEEQGDYLLQLVSGIKKKEEVF